MQKLVTIKNALVSVFHKDGLLPIVRQLSDHGVNIFSTGGTASFLQEAGIEVNLVEDLTDYPSILGGRVKTLHPKVFGGILARRELDSDLAQMEEYELPSFDLVIVDLYPFSETVRNTTDQQAIIEKIDIGGVSLIRAAAKNFKDVWIVSSMTQYDRVLSILKEGASTGLDQRQQFAKEAFANTKDYDTDISAYFGDPVSTGLRYGENPHQSAVFYGKLEDAFEQLNGKELSYNNLVDMESAVYLMEDVAAMAKDKPAFAILKHTNACGVAIADTLCDAWKKALAADPVSAFGGILVANCEVDEETATAMNELFFEVVIAPSYSKEALDILCSKKNRRVLVQKQFTFPSKQKKTLFHGELEMDRNLSLSTGDSRKVATRLHPSREEVDDLLFAEIVVKHLKSNGIALVRNRQLIGMGTGQTSRVDALNQAIAKANAFGFDTNGAVMASEAFFPFPDCVEIAHKAGINSVIQPGGSVKDQDSIDYCDANGMNMILTGIRHFKH